MYYFHLYKNNRVPNLKELTCLKDLSRSLLEAWPCIELATMALASDLELPGLPTRKSGILKSTQMAIMKMFSLKAALRAMFLPNSILSNSTSWYLEGERERGRGGGGEIGREVRGKDKEKNSGGENSTLIFTI